MTTKQGGMDHLWTTIPWYRYQRVFGTIEGELERQGARIGWAVEPLPEIARGSTAWSLFAVEQ